MQKCILYSEYFDSEIACRFFSKTSILQVDSRARLTDVRYVIISVNIFLFKNSF